MNLHILSDPVSDFWKCPKKGFKKSYLRRFLVPNFAARHAPPSPGVTHERERVWSSAVPSYEDNFESRLHYERTADCKCLKLAINDGGQTVLYCTVLYCTVVNCPIFIPHYNYFLGKAHLKKQHPYLGHCPNRGGGV